ncbi:iron complex outermembrane recepter protein [Flavobacterium omnivorum]|uniref:Iron complex outermembrane recepter protein n=1 Tax=Flavobacterium omnivorum TaxID=178355 RepID=A0A1G7YMR7_9FLAO|nr:TonB-dependent receptor [Flavobacterium omnivorum]SDG97519.1 iron complex outermembrane recepter protein [Flavobacterium omnivorum]
MQTKIYIVFCFCLFCTLSFAQNTVSGKITTLGGIPLSGSHIHIGKKTVSSDAAGNYVIKKLPVGNIKVFVSYVGYKSVDTLVNLSGDQVLNFTLKENADQLQEVVIRQKANTLNKSLLEQKIKTETIEKFSNQTLGDILKEVAGVSSLKTGSSVVKPVINGLFGSRVPVINNNVRLEDQEWGTEHAPNFDINAAGKITVIKGASGLQYGGDAVGGLVIIEPISVKRDTLFGKTILNLASNGRGGSVSTSLHKGNDKGWSWNALGTFKYSGDKEAPGYVLSNSGNREANFSGDVKFTGKKYDISGYYSLYNTTIGILSASHTGNVNDLYNSITNKIPSVVNDFTYTIKNPKQKVQHHLAKLNYNYYFDETASLAVQYSFQFNKRLEFDVRRGGFNDIAALDLELTTNAVNVDFKKTVHDWTLKTGFSTSFQNNFANPATGIKPLIPNFDRIEFGTYAIASYDLSDSFSVDAGLRYDFSRVDATKFYLKSRWEERGYATEFADFIVGEQGNQWLTKPSFTFHNISASAGFHKEFEADLNWYSNISLATRNPNPSEFFSDGLHHSTGIIELGDLVLDKEQAIKLSTTLQKKWNAFSVEVNPFINSIRNFMFLRPIDFETTTRGAFPVWEYQQTNARLAGVDVQTHWKISKQWQHDFTLAYVNGKDISNKESLIDIPPLNLSNKIQFLNREWHDLKLELKSEIVLRQNQFPDNNFIANIIKNNELVPVLVDISTPPPGYQLLHFYSEMRFKTFGKTNATIAFSVQNILNTTYRDYLNRQRFFADEMGRNFQIQLKFNY